MLGGRSLEEGGWGWRSPHLALLGVPKPSILKDFA